MRRRFVPSAALALAACGVLALLASPAPSAAPTHEGPLVDVRGVVAAAAHGDLSADGHEHAHDLGDAEEFLVPGMIEVSSPARGVINAKATAGGATGPTEFFFPDWQGYPMSWDTCKPIKWAVDMTDAGPSASEVVSQITRALGEITAITRGVNPQAPGGYEFRRVDVNAAGWARPAGPTADGWKFNVGAGSDHPDVDLIFGFGAGVSDRSTAKYRSELLNGRGAAAGGPFGAYYQSERDWWDHGAVLIDAVDFQNAVSSDAYRVTLLRHEISHVMGLSHAQKGQVMFKIVGGPLAFQGGDKDGLQTLAATPCQ